MTLSVQADFYRDIGNGTGQVDGEAVVAGLRTACRVVLDWPVDRIVDLLDAFSRRLLARDCGLHRAYPGSGIPFIAQWCRAANLRALLDEALGDRRALDDFRPGPARADRAYRAFPRGLVVHWMAGNVPTLGFLSLIQGVLTKNANVVKLASGADRLLADLMGELASIAEAQGAGELARTMAVLRFDRTDRQANEFFSRAADVRVLWGDDESLAAVRALPTGLETGDVVFPARTSLVAITADALAGEDMDAAARRIALDISVFEQKACASPHTIFLETGDDAVVDDFALRLRAGLQAALQTVPRSTPSGQEVSAILNLRARYDIAHRAWYSQGVEYTIFADDEFKLGPAIGGRTVFLRRVTPLERVAELVTPKVQSVGILAGPDSFERVTAALGAAGVQRFTRPGAMTHFESPWDGFFIPQHMVRWTSRPN